MVKKIVEGNKLAEGEVTGHAHRVQVQVMEREDGVREFLGATIVTHEEHKPITLPDHKWLSAQVTEVDHLTEQTRKVAD